ncbi:MAG: hypothetical protein GEU95_12905 [Rhizobiales bacterium]|nr:hypothetical protein [Hyphomicrobiales bacterium]
MVRTTFSCLVATMIFSMAASDHAVGKASSSFATTDNSHPSQDVVAGDQKYTAGIKTAYMLIELLPVNPPSIDAYSHGKSGKAVHKGRRQGNFTGKQRRQGVGMVTPAIQGIRKPSRSSSKRRR